MALIALRLADSLVRDVAAGTLPTAAAMCAGSSAVARCTAAGAAAASGASSAAANSATAKSEAQTGRTPRAKPTHFLALRLPDPRLHAQLSELQAELAARQAELARCAVPAVKTHLTAFVFMAQCEEDVAAARDALGACAPLAEAHFTRRPPQVALRGLGSFGSRVLYADVEHGDDRDRLVSFVAATSELFRARGLLDSSDGSWQPHVTVLKTSRAAAARGRKQRVVKIPPAVWQDRADVDFGAHALPSLQLCAMAGVDPSGYYVVESELPLG